MRFPIERRTFLKSVGLASASTLLPVSAPFSLAGGDVASKPAATDAWQLFRRDLQNTGEAPGTLPEKLELLWEVETPDGVTSTPVISRGRAYCGTVSGDLHCITLADGKVQWTYKSVEVVEKNSFAPAFNAALAMNDKLIFGGDDMGRFHAVDIATGKSKWTFDTEGEIVGGALEFDGKVLFGSHDNNLYCLKAETGEKIWSCETHGPVNATPTLDGKFTFTTGCDQPILRVIDIESGMQAEEVPIDALLLASAAVKDEILYFGTDGGTVFALDWKKRKTVWQYSVPNRQQRIQSSPAVTEKYVVIGSRDKHVHCLDRETGKPVWTFPTRAQVDGSPVVVGDRVCIGSGDKNLYVLSLADGKELWKHNAGQSFTGSPAIAEGKLVIGTDSSNGKILCFGAV